MTPPSGARLLITTDAVGGVWVYASTLAAALARRGCRVLLVSMGPSPRRDQLQAVSGIPGLQVEITDYALEWMDPEGADADRALYGLAKLARAFGPDVVHLNSYREACADWGAPVLVVAHSCVRSWWRACHGGEPGEPRWQTYMRNVEAGLAAADAWAAPTAAFRDRIAALYAPPSSGLVIRNGFDPVPTEGPKEPFILAAGRLWDDAKNIAVLGGGAEDLPWPIQVAGSDRSGHNVATLGGNLQMLGELSRHDLLTRMQQAAIFVSPALYEPFGLTVVEAAACGCALVLSDIPTFRELWDGAALFADPRSPTALHAALRRLVEDAELRGSLRRAARERAQLYPLTATVDGYRAAYDRLQAPRFAPHSAPPAQVSGVPL
jgi:glycosyltransferase involved in cell wall biosynthesis